YPTVLDHRRRFWVFEEVTQGGHRALGLDQGVLQSGQVSGDELRASGLVGRPQHPSDVVDGHLEIPEPADHLSGRDLGGRVSAIAGDRGATPAWERGGP